MLPRVFILCWFVVACSAVIADERDSLVRSLESGRYELGTNLRILEDKAGELTIDQVSRIKDKRFVSNSSGIANLGITPYTYWLEINIEAFEGGKEKDFANEWYLEIGRALLDVAELYVPDSKGDTRYKRLTQGHPLVSVQFIT